MGGHPPAAIPIVVRECAVCVCLACELRARRCVVLKQQLLAALPCISARSFVFVKLKMTSVFAAQAGPARRGGAATADSTRRDGERS